MRPLAAGDVAEVVALTRASAEAAQWSAAEFERIAGEEVATGCAWVAVAGPGIVGYIVTRCAAEEVEILNLAVAAGARRKGIAGRLLERALAAAQAGPARRAFLEVRESNRAAIALYQRHHFLPAGRRALYYGNPPEDALVLARTL